MSWQPPPNRPGGSPPPGGGGGGGGSAPGGSSAAAPAASTPESNKDLTLYQLLQVDRDAHSTIIRYAYRFLAAMYHPDNGETGDAEKFRVVTEAWKTLSDDGKRAAYDMSLGLQEASQGKTTQAKPKMNEFGREALPNIPKSGITWNEVELRLGILQVLLAARKKRPQTGGASGKMLMDCLNMDNIAEIEFAIWYLREKKLLEPGERVFMITAEGVDYLTDQLGKTQVLGDVSGVEKKVDKIVAGGVPAVIKR